MKLNVCVVMKSGHKFEISMLEEELSALVQGMISQNSPSTTLPLTTKPHVIFSRCDLFIDLAEVSAVYRGVM